MKTHLVRALFALAFSAMPVPAVANDTAWGGTPGNLFPIQTTDVAMVEEHVVLRLNSATWSWDVRVEFTFKNVSAKDVKVRMGFPFGVLENKDETPYATPKGVKDVENNDPMVWDFTTTVGGKAVKYKRENVKLNAKHPDLYYEWAYVWPMTFKAGEEVKVVNRYRQGITEDSSGHVMPYYVLKTGSMWHGGKIGRSRIEIIGDESVVPCAPDDAPAVVPKGAQLERAEAGPVLRWDLKDFAPTEDVEGCFRRRQHIRNLTFYELEDTKLETLSADQLRILRNTVFALHGYTFKDPKLAAHFEAMPWYYPRKSFQNGDLTQEEVAFVKAVQAEERRRKKK